MNRPTLLFVLILIPLVAAAQQPGAQPQPAEQPAAQQPSVTGMPLDDNIEAIARDLHALGRIATLSQEIDDSRQVMLAITDADIEQLRMPRPDGTYKWATLQREEGGRVKDEKTIEQVHTEKELRNVTVTGANGYRVMVTVPQKRGLIRGNNRVWVRNILVDSTGFDGKTTHSEIPVNAWVNPGDANGVALPDIGKSVKVTAELGVESGSKVANAEVALLQAKLVDDPTSPYFPAVKRLLQIRQFAAEEKINRGYLKNAVDEALLAVPGELEKRTAAQTAAAEEMKRLALTGETKGAIALGDATPDVVNEMAEISRLMTGTLDDQTAARTRLATLIDTLQPKPAEPVVVPVAPKQ
jgi:hypothetical protein